MTARNETAIAALEAGIAINNSSVTVVHGMSRPIGALYHVPHGLSNAMLLYKCMSFALDGATTRFAVLGRAINAADCKADDKTAATAFLDAIGDICKKLEVPSLAEYGIDKEDFFGNGSGFFDQADVCRTLLKEYLPQAEAFHALLQKKKKLILTGTGASLYACQMAKYIFFR